MHILMLNYEFPPLGGGAGNATYYLLREFSKYKNMNITLVTSSINRYKKEKFSSNVIIYYLDIGKKGSVHYQSLKDLLIYSWKSYWFCRKLKRKNTYHFTHAFFGIPCGFIAKKLKLPYVVSLRGSDVPFYNMRFKWLDKFIFQKLSRRIWKKAKKVIANSEGLKELTLKTALDQEIDVIYNGVDIQQFKPYNPLSRTVPVNGLLTIISTSRLIERKGISHLIQAFIDFNKKYRNSRLLLIGSGDLEDELKLKVKKANIENKVEFLGVIPHGQISDQYKRADVFVLPSYNEGMSNSLLEAMASGLAIISTNVGGSEELVDHMNGIIIRKQSSSDIVNALKRLYVNKELLRSMKGRSNKKAQYFSWETIAEQYAKHYE